MGKVKYNIVFKPKREEALCIRNKGCEVAINLHPSQVWYGRVAPVEETLMYELMHKGKGVWLVIDPKGVEEFFVEVNRKE